MAASEWRSLFDGASLKDWRGYKTDKVPDGWRAENGTLTKDKPVADIVTRDQFGDFELELEWKIGEAGNAGIFYRGTEEYDHIYWSAPEYQLLDDIKGADNKSRLTSAGAAYAHPAVPCRPPETGRRVEPRAHRRQGQPCRALAERRQAARVRIRQRRLGPPRSKASKFKDWPNYGKPKRGHIALQGDHEGSLAFRNIRIRELK